MAKFQLLANVHSRTFINLVLFVLWLWRFVIYYLMQDLTHGFLLWIITCFYELLHAWNACLHSFVHAVPMDYNSKPHPSSFLSPGPTHSFIPSSKSPLRGIAHQFSAFSHSRDNYQIPVVRNHCDRLSALNSEQDRYSPCSLINLEEDQG